MIAFLKNNAFLRAYFLSQIASRSLLCIYALLKKQIIFKELYVIFILGFINDFITSSYFLPVITICSIIFYKFTIKHNFFNLAVYFLFFFLIFFVFLTNIISEYIFWDEFGTRYNFIAVDYLIYTHEIIGTLKESLPIFKIIIGILCTSTIMSIYSVRSFLKRKFYVNIKIRLLLIIITSIFSIISVKFYNSDLIIFSQNKYVQELGKNGFFELFSAFYNNILNYNQLYVTLPDKEVIKTLRSNVIQYNQNFINNNTLNRVVSAKASIKHYNVILITVESFSNEFIGMLQKGSSITPYVDRLIKESVIFTNMYATGTRTVRGLEALTLAIPPTPGSSIIRRPNNNDLFTIGSVFQEWGYSTYFFFGGYSYFDNLKNYFINNNYNLVDRSDFKENEVSFSNIWGIADEDIFSKTINIIDQENKQGKKVFALVMTTSNHRPYTFPSNRINLKSGSGRNAAVKYTDYAIGKFIEDSKKKSWFDKTIFVITADHCASSSGKTDLPINKYHIPFIIYAPKLFKHKKISNLISQIDIAPTILGLIGREYRSKFFGKDIFISSSDRAFISTYQLLGYMKGRYLVMLGPKKFLKTYQLIGSEKQEISNIPELVKEAISFYQGAYNFFVDGKLHYTKFSSNKPKLRKIVKR